ncbi:DUF4846 domain-containing protein [Niabella beijingensis]|uniref:DUF4846 domain-containing protein n=1 Tax=Niabella beijingensis TaxID=2872700 RepID=UPI001CC06978|nr:DUF4846 domain-containing protein [Niabella beijingensis]MBZ4190145.1 DUF4846 domain-containing protein [Niabella beijingensis]
MKITPLLLILGSWLFPACEYAAPDAAAITTVPSALPEEVLPATISRIRVPEGFTRHQQPAAAFATYLQQLPLKKDKQVHLFNGTLKENQQAQYAVLDVSVGTKDLQQCADAVMRLRAEYLFAAKRFSEIRFNAGDGTWIRYDRWLKGTRYRLSGRKLIEVSGSPVTSTHATLLQYLETVFAYCGTATLPSSLYSKPLKELQPGDVFLKPGAPGHAVIVVDMAENKKGKKSYLLAQSYMPAQDIHILKNPTDEEGGPWYALTDAAVIQTPEWTFYSNQLYGWK